MIFALHTIAPASGGRRYDAWPFFLQKGENATPAPLILWTFTKTRITTFSLLILFEWLLSLAIQLFFARNRCEAQISLPYTSIYILRLMKIILNFIEISWNFMEFHGISWACLILSEDESFGKTQKRRKACAMYLAQSDPRNVLLLSIEGRLVSHGLASRFPDFREA